MLTFNFKLLDNFSRQLNEEQELGSIKPLSKHFFHTHDIHLLAGYKCERAPGIIKISYYNNNNRACMYVYTTTEKSLRVRSS